MTHARSALFVPGSRPDRFSKAVGSGADFVIIDLEDSVAPAQKERARQEAVNWIRTRPGAAVAVRINSPHDSLGGDDLSALAGLHCPIVLPKIEQTTDLDIVLESQGPECPVVGLVETATGLVQLGDLVHARGLSRLAFGNVDLAGDVGIDHRDPEALRYARSRLVLHSAAAGLPQPLDGVTTEIHNGTMLEAECAEAIRLGFAGKLCIHPSQLAAVNAHFTPSQKDVAWATKVLATSDSGVSLVDGAMVDAPVVRKARHILARADVIGTS